MDGRSLDGPGPVQYRSSWRALLTREIGRCRSAVERALDLAGRTGRSDLGARAVLEAEPVGSRRWDLRLIRWCNEALARLDGEPGPLAARLQARRAEAELYSGQEEAAERSSREALRQPYTAADADAVVAGLFTYPASSPSVAPSTAWNGPAWPSR